MLMSNTQLTAKYSWFMIFKYCILQNKLSHTSLSYQHKSKSKSVDVSYPVFQREKHLTWSPIPYEDKVLCPMQPHQITMWSQILNPQAHCWEKWYSNSWKVSGKMLQCVLVGFDLHICQRRVLREVRTQDWAQGSLLDCRALGRGWEWPGEMMSSAAAPPPATSWTMETGQRNRSKFMTWNGSQKVKWRTLNWKPLTRDTCRRINKALLYSIQSHLGFHLI